jgi:hypothetical protein
MSVQARKKRNQREKVITSMNVRKRKKVLTWSIVVVPQAKAVTKNAIVNVMARNLGVVVNPSFPDNLQRMFLLDFKSRPRKP